MNTKITAIALLITGTLTLSACAPMPHGSAGPIGPTDPYTPVVTTPAPPTTTNPGTTTPLQQYVIQLTASNSPAKAERISNKFTSDGYNAFVSPLNVNGKTLHRVQIGMFDNMDAAKVTLAKMQAKYPTDPYVADAVTKTP